MPVLKLSAHVHVSIFDMHVCATRSSTRCTGPTHNKKQCTPVCATLSCWVVPLQLFSKRELAIAHYSFMRQDSMKFRHRQSLTCLLWPACLSTRLSQSDVVLETPIILIACGQGAMSLRHAQSWLSELDYRGATYAVRPLGKNRVRHFIGH